MSTVLAQFGVGAETVAAPAISGTPTVATGPGGIQQMTITFASAHGLTAHLSWLTLAGITPAGYVGRWPVIGTPTTTQAVILLNTSLGAVTVAGTASKQTPGAGATPTRWFNFTKYGVKTPRPTADVEMMGSVSRRLGKSSTVPFKDAPKGPIEMPVMSNGFGWWLDKLVGGTPATTSLGGAPTAFRHTSVLGNLNGSTFASEINQPFQSGIQSLRQHRGLKVTGWELSMKKRGLLMLSIDVIGIDEAIPATLTVAALATGDEPGSFCGSFLSLDTVMVPCHEWSLKADMGLSDDVSRLKADCTPIEALSSGTPSFELSAEVDYRDEAFRAKYASLTPANRFGAIVLDTVFATQINSTPTFPEFKVTLPSVRIDGDDVEMSGIQLITQKVSGVVFDPESGAAPITIDYVTSDATP